MSVDADGWCDGTCAAASTVQARFCDGDAVLSVRAIITRTSELHGTKTAVASQQKEKEKAYDGPNDPIGLFIGAAFLCDSANAQAVAEQGLAVHDLGSYGNADAACLVLRSSETEECSSSFAEAQAAEATRVCWC